jgi:hypothetical protein
VITTSDSITFKMEFKPDRKRQNTIPHQNGWASFVWTTAFKAQQDLVFDENFSTNSFQNQTASRLLYEGMDAWHRWWQEWDDFAEYSPFHSETPGDYSIFALFLAKTLHTGNAAFALTAGIWWSVLF